MALFHKFKQLLELRQDVDKLKQDFSVIQHEWNDWFERFKRLHARIARRQQREEQAEELRASAENGGAEESPSGLVGLTPHQREVQRQIELRRKLTSTKGA